MPVNMQVNVSSLVTFKNLLHVECLSFGRASRISVSHSVDCRCKDLQSTDRSYFKASNVHSAWVLVTSPFLVYKPLQISLELTE